MLIVTDSLRSRIIRQPPFRTLGRCDIPVADHHKETIGIGWRQIVDNQHRISWRWVVWKVKLIRTWHVVFQWTDSSLENNVSCPAGMGLVGIDVVAVRPIGGNRSNIDYGNWHRQESIPNGEAVLLVVLIDGRGCVKHQRFSCAHAW